ncbi:MAG TPA: hypothetical protein VGE39_20215 [Prosthecobacter sp.]
MKTHTLASLCLIVAATLAQAREFTDLQGRKLDAELMSVAGGQATLKRQADGRMFTVPVASFSQADQKFMNEFAAANLSYAFDITYTKKKLDSVTRSSGPTKETVESWAYKLEMRNKQPVELQNLRVDYWLFRKADEGKGKGSARVATSGSHKAEAMKGSAIYAFETLPVELSKSKLEGNFIYIDGSRPRSQDVMGGIVIRVFDPNNKEVFKYATDEDLYAAAMGKTRGSDSNSGVAGPK